MLAVFFAQKAFVVHAGCLLAVRRNANDRHHPLKWEVPGGRLDAGEELDDQLIREVFEESGVTIVPQEPFFIWKWSIATTPNLPSTIVAVARHCRALNSALSVQGRVEGDDLDLVEWIPLSGLNKYEWIPNMVPVLDAFTAYLKVVPRVAPEDRL